MSALVAHFRSAPKSSRVPAVSQLWDVESMDVKAVKELAHETPYSHPGITSVAISNDGNKIYSCENEKTMKVWEVQAPPRATWEPGMPPLELKLLEEIARDPALFAACNNGDALAKRDGAPLRLTGGAQFFAPSLLRCCAVSGVHWVCGSSLDEVFFLDVLTDAQTTMAAAEAAALLKGKSVRRGKAKKAPSSQFL